MKMIIEGIRTAEPKKPHSWTVANVCYLGLTPKHDGFKAMMIGLGPTLAFNMLTDFGELDQITQYDDVATYAGEITTPEGAITYLVDFIKENGSWKIFSF